MRCTWLNMKILIVQNLSPAPWNYMWKPGPYPEDQDARIAAAKKYGMILEDYKPYEDPDVMAGDYPCLPIEPMDERLEVIMLDFFKQFVLGINYMNGIILSIDETMVNLFKKNGGSTMTLVSAP